MLLIVKMNSLDVLFENPFPRSDRKKWSDVNKELTDEKQPTNSFKLQHLTTAPCIAHTGRKDSQAILYKREAKKEKVTTVCKWKNTHTICLQIFFPRYVSFKKDKVYR
jgi:hypothetical protein